MFLEIIALFEVLVLLVILVIRPFRYARCLLLPHFAAIMGVMFQALLTFLLPMALAQPENLKPPDSPACDAIFLNGGFNTEGAGFTCIADYIVNLTFVVIGLAASISLIMLMINGFRYMIGPAIPGGSSDAAKKGIGAALTGLVLALLTYVILDTLIAFVTQ